MYVLMLISAINLSFQKKKKWAQHATFAPCPATSAFLHPTIVLGSFNGSVHLCRKIAPPIFVRMHGEDGNEHAAQWLQIVALKKQAE
jgi:hypothetical protein